MPLPRVFRLGTFSYYMRVRTTTTAFPCLSLSDLASIPEAVDKKRDVKACKLMEEIGTPSSLPSALLCLQFNDTTRQYFADLQACAHTEGFCNFYDRDLTFGPPKRTPP
jgi:hypothetical protein